MIYKIVNLGYPLIFLPSLHYKFEDSFVMRFFGINYVRKANYTNGQLDR
jgi:hypothetical protein